MTRSLIKPPYINPYLYKKRLQKDRPVTVWARNSFILPQFVGYIFRIHQGKKFIRHKITEEMVGGKFGEYASTRKANIYKKKLKQKKK
jgi:small subunit ribosomal protein S19